jgi:uncharacterized membrane protein YcaP (DUF421 family)
MPEPQVRLWRFTRAFARETQMDKLFEVDWPALFIPTHSLAEMIVRGTLMYLGLFCILRFVMKRQTGSLGTADILLIVVIADAAQNAFSKQYQSIGEGIVLVATIVFWDFFIDWLTYKVPALGDILEPPPIALIRNGRMIRRNMRQEMISAEEIKAQLRQHGVEQIADVKIAYIESDGAVSVVRRTPEIQSGRKTPGAG